MGFFEKISARIELFRLEKRYTKRRSTFVSDAIYVDGEYIYQNPSPTKRRSAVLFSSSEESVSNEDIRAHCERMEREAALQAQRGVVVTEVCDSELGNYGTLKVNGQGKTDREKREHMDRIGACPAGSQSDASPSARQWGSTRTVSRKSLMTIQRVRWEMGGR